MPYQFIKEFEDNYEPLYNEYLTVKNNAYPWPELDLHEGGWDVFGLYLGPEYKYVSGMPAGLDKLEADDCPFTRKLIKDNVPSHGTAGFSILRGGSVILPHVGIESNYLRMHLGLKIPEGDTGLQVESYGTFKWEAGKAFYFKDNNLHSAWNKTDEDRVIFLLDFDPNTE